MDRDFAVIPEAQKLEKKFKKRFKFYQLKFSQINQIFNHKVDTIDFDLGDDDDMVDDDDMDEDMDEEANGGADESKAPEAPTVPAEPMAAPAVEAVTEKMAATLTVGESERPAEPAKAEKKKKKKKKKAFDAFA